MKNKQLSFAEGYTRGLQDCQRGNSCDPYRWIKAWALKAYLFEDGYIKGYNQCLKPLDKQQKS